MATINDEYDKGIRIISFDGGGPGVLSELFTLKEIMYRLQNVLDLDDLPRPCHFVDLVAGCGLGGFAALLLGRLGLSIDDTIEAVAKVGPLVCCKGESSANGKKLNTNKLRVAIAEVVRRHGFEETVMLLEEDGTASPCKTFVCLTPAVTMMTCHHLRTYTSPLSLPLNCTVVDAALATMASSLYFDPVQIGRQLFLGASLGYNNPTREAIREAWDVWGADRSVACILSLGTGASNALNKEKPVENLLRDILEDCDKIANDLKGQLQAPDLYMRLSVLRGLDNIDVQKWDPETVGVIESHTKDYISHLSSHKLATFIESLVNRPSRTSIGALNKAHRETVYSKSVPLVSQFFVPRETLFEQMSDYLLAKVANKRSIVVLHGAGGGGKTQLVSYFVQRYRQNYSHIFYVDASSLASLQADLKAAIRSLGVTYLYGTYKDALAFLAQPSNTRWLLVYDNADDTSVSLEAYLPQCEHGSIVITTRNAHHAGLAPDSSIEVGPMTEPEAIEALLYAASRPKDTPRSERQYAKEIVRALGFLPAAIVQAGRSCSRGQSLNMYLSLFDAQPRKLLERGHAGSLDQYRYPSVYAALSVSRNDLEAIPKQFLHLAAFFHHSDIPVAMIIAAIECSFNNPAEYIAHSGKVVELRQRLRQCLAPEATDSSLALLHIDGILESLGSFSLINRTNVAGRQLFHFHPLTQVWARSILSPDEQIINNHMAALVLSCCSDKKHQSLHSSIVPHIQAVLGISSSLHPNYLAAFAPLLHEAGEYDQACKLWRTVRDRCIEEHGLANVTTVRASLSFAQMLRDCGKFDEAEEVGAEVVEISGRFITEDVGLVVRAFRSAAVTFECQVKWESAAGQLYEALKILEGSKGDHTELLLEVQEHLAVTHQEQGHWQKAESLRSQILGARREKLGVDHEKTIEAMVNLADTYLEQGRWNEAASMQSQVLQIRSQCLGMSHPATMAAATDLAVTYERLGRWNAAVTLQEDLLETRRRLLPNDHPDLIEAAGNLASTYCNQGRWVDAEKLQREVLSMRRSSLGNEHKETAYAISELAATLYDMGRYSQAEKLQREALAIRKKVLGENHPDTLISISSLACTLSDMGKWTRAEQLARDAIEKMKELMPKNHPDTLNAIGGLAFTLSEQGRYEDAEKLQRELLEAYESTLGEHPDTLIARRDLASTYCELGKWSDALALQLKVVEQSRELLDEQHPDALLASRNLAWTYLQMGRWKDAYTLLETTVSHMTISMGPNHPDTIEARSDLATTLYEMGRFAEAEDIQREVLKLRKTLNMDYEPHEATSLSMESPASKDLVEAERHHEETLQSLGREHPDTLLAMGDLALTIANAGRWDDAAKLQVETLKSCEVVFGKRHPSTLEAMGNLAATYSLMMETVKAEELQKEVLEISEKVLGEHHPDTILAKSALAATYSDTERYEDALKLQIDLVDLHKRYMGEEHPETLTAQMDLALTYSEMGSTKEAEALQRTMVEKCTRILGKEHPDTCCAITNLASTLSQQENWEEAAELQSSVIDISRKVLGSGHPDFLANLTNLSQTYTKLGRWADAEALQRQVVDGWAKKVAGREHPRYKRANSALQQIKQQRRELEGYVDKQDEQILSPVEVDSPLSEGFGLVHKFLETFPVLRRIRLPSSVTMLWAKWGHLGFYGGIILWVSSGTVNYWYTRFSIIVPGRSHL